MVTQMIDHISYQLKEPHDFSFLSKHGKAFCTFDQNDSGNISFGMSDGSMRYFVKVAGAKTAEACNDTREAVEVLKNAMPLYEECKHPALIELVEHYELNDLYVAVFRWAEGECLYDHWNFEKYAANPKLLSPRKRFRQLPVQKRLASMKIMIEFLVLVESKGYVAVDFYDGSIMYDFESDTTTICDIDFFRKKPAYNNIGADFWGTKRLKAPEEYTYGASINGATNVFTLGAMTFHFFGSYTEEELQRMYKDKGVFPCSPEKWELGQKLYDISCKAVNPDPKKRYDSVKGFYSQWNKAVNDFMIHSI